ncbi:MAG: alkaline phosphatase PhoX [Terriglobia bacterium]
MRNYRFRYRTLRHLATTVVMVALFFIVMATLGVADDDDDNDGFLTDEPAMLTAVAPGGDVKPIMTVGDTLANGYRFEAIPDGIGIDLRGTDDDRDSDDDADDDGNDDGERESDDDGDDDGERESDEENGFVVFVNHETSTVPFFGADFDNAQVSRLVLKRESGEVVDGSFAIPSSANFLRFCSSFLAGAAEGFDPPLYFTNEETSNMVNRTGLAWPPGAGSDPEQAGFVVALDPDTGEFRKIPGMGRHNHENSVAIPGYDDAVILSGDDTFSAPSSQLYMYIADDRDDVWEDEGHLFAFKATGANDYGDIGPGDSFSGLFIPVPDAIADGDQSGLETWSNDNDVFQFIRVEDIAYDRNDPTVVYIADTGEPRAIADATTGRLKRGPRGTNGPFPNGRIFKMVLSPSDPTIVQSLSILIDGDACVNVGTACRDDLSLIHNPDNLETTPYSLMIQEDPGSQNRFAFDDPNGTAARIWRYNLATGELSVVAVVDQSAFDPTADLGRWESSGIVDASAMFGRGAFLVDVQAHTISIEDAVGTEIDPTTGNLVNLKREGGQLLLLRIPGA